MDKLLSCAKYLFEKYKQDSGGIMDEMKMHKLMYFAQRENLLSYGVPLFQGQFYAWKYGPVLKEIRREYQSGSCFLNANCALLSNNDIIVLNRVYNYYSRRDSWSLSRLTHGEFSWQNARLALVSDETSDCPIKDEDIVADAKRIGERRKMFGQK